MASKLNVEFTGLIKDNEVFLNHIESAQLFIFSSLNEAMPVTLLEVAANKVPIISSDIAECRAIFNQEEVLFFKAGDVDDLACKIQWALSHEADMLEMALRAYHKVETKFSWHEIATQYQQLYISFDQNN